MIECKSLRFKIITLILLFFILFNFIMTPYIYASGLAVALGIKFGIPLGSKILTFIMMSAGVGVTFASLDMAEEMFNAWWEEMGNQLSELDWSKLAFKVGNVFDNAVSNVKDFFRSKGAVEGDNIVYDGSNVYDIAIGQKINVSIPLVENEIKRIVFNGKVIYFRHVQHYLQFSRYSNMSSPSTVINVGVNQDWFHIKAIERTEEYYYRITTDSKISSSGIVTERTNGMRIASSYSNSTDLPSQSIPYVVAPSSHVLDDSYPVQPWQPSLHGLGIEQIINPDGTVSDVYDGTIEQLLEDVLLKEVEYDNLITDVPYSVVETSRGLEISYEDSPSIPVPYPDVDFGPIENQAEFQGKNVGLLQSIMNLLSTIPAFINSLFVIPENLSLDFSGFQGLALTDKFPFCLPWDLKRSFDILVSPPSAPYFELSILDHKIELDFSQFELWASISRTFFSIIFVTTMIISTRKFIGGA
ncbi:MAG: hypothetical protein AB2417_20090 [Clostridiaceae bacterium]